MNTLEPPSAGHAAVATPDRTINAPAICKTTEVSPVAYTVAPRLPLLPNKLTVWKPYLDGREALVQDQVCQGDLPEQRGLLQQREHHPCNASLAVKERICR